MPTTRREPTSPDDVYSFDGWSVFPRCGLAIRAATEGRLPPRVMDLLVHLLRQAPRAKDRRDWEVLWLEHLPELRSLHDDPRFVDLLARRLPGHRS